MKTFLIVLSVIAVLALIALIVLYVLGRRTEKKQAEQQEQMEAIKQQMSMLIIDKKMLPMKSSGLPEQVIASTPWYLKRTKVPIVKAKIGPRIMILMCDNSIYPLIPVKKEVKATVSGIYITGVKGIRGSLEAPKKLTWKERIFGNKDKKN